MGFQAIEDNSP